MSKLMRVSDVTAKRIDELIELTGKSRQEIIDRAIIKYEHEQILKKANEQYAALKKDPVAWQEMLDDEAVWDATLADGLEDYD